MVANAFLGNNQSQCSLSQADPGGRAAVEFEAVFLDAVAENHSVLRHERDDLSREAIDCRAKPNTANKMEAASRSEHCRVPENHLHENGHAGQNDREGEATQSRRVLGIRGARVEFSSLWNGAVGPRQGLGSSRCRDS